MSFQAYLDNIEEKTGKTPKQFIAEAKKKKLTESKDIIAWLKNDYGLGTHRDPSGTLLLEGRKNRSNELPAKLGAPAERALANAGIKNLKQLTKFTEAEIKELHGVGPNAVAKLRQALADSGLSFAERKKKKSA
jgi:hypothetical protein